MSDSNAYLETIERLEPEIAHIDASAFYASAAISLKRIADTLDKSHGPIVPRGKLAQRAIDALREWHKFQSASNITTLYNTASELFGSKFNPADYDDVGD